MKFVRALDLEHEMKLAVLSALVEGNTVRAVSRATDVHGTMDSLVH